MHTLIYLLLLFFVIFFAVRLATKGHVDNKKPKKSESQIVYKTNDPIS